MTKFGYIFDCFIDAPKIIKDAKLKKYYLIPGIIGFLLFIMAIQGYLRLTRFTGKYFTTLAAERDFSGSIFGTALNYLINFLAISDKFIIPIVLAIIFFFVFKPILIVLISPILSFLSEKIDEHLTNNKFEFSLKDNIKFILRGLKIGVICFLKQIIGTIILILIGFIPIIGLLSPILIFLIQSYFTGFAFMDYTLERYQFSTKDSMKFIRKKRSYSVICGCVFTLLLIIPFIGIFIAPLITCAAVTKLTIFLIKDDDEYSDFLTMKTDPSQIK